jgi:NADH-quinone oxidoreductase subunit E
VLPAWGAPRPKEIDDLQLIWGVGPKLEKLLHSLGIWTFRQVASWTKKDIVEIDTRLEVFHGRIDRDGWVASAKSEHMKKYEEKL